MKTIQWLIPSLIVSFALPAQTVKRPMHPNDIYRLPVISDLAVSPNDKWIAYTLSKVDTVKDRRETDIWMVNWDGTKNIQLTNTAGNESKPRWSPDGKFLSFLSAREQSDGQQVWLLDMDGGEARKITGIKGGVNDYSWSPGGKKLLLNITDRDNENIGPKTPPPIVISRYWFKKDISGYQHKSLYSHLYLFDIATSRLDTLTSGNYDDRDAVFSPDGKRVAFVSKRTGNPDENINSDIFIAEAKPGAAIKQLTTWDGLDEKPQWSSDGKKILYLRASSNIWLFSQNIVAVVNADGGQPALLSEALDRQTHHISWTGDNKGAVALVDDDLRTYIAIFSADYSMKKILDEPDKSFTALAVGNQNKLAVIMSEPYLPGEIFAIENGNKRRLTRHMEDFLAPIRLGTVKAVSSKAKDGTVSSGVLYLPPGDTAARNLPLVLWIKGGPQANREELAFNRLSLRGFMLAAAGYAVLSVNHRGSLCCGMDFCKAVYADMANKELGDLNGAVDNLIKQGIADSTRLGIGGWSYGGTLTNMMISSGNRFKAACSGAGLATAFANYGTDMYVLEYDNEFKPPWENPDLYTRLSPLLKADKITTPTLFMGGLSDFNVPISNSEQMYQALKSRGIPTGLVIYPGQFHAFTTPSYERDRFTRWIAWYDTYLKNKPPGLK